MPCIWHGTETLHFQANFCCCCWCYISGGNWELNEFVWTFGAPSYVRATKAANLLQFFTFRPDTDTECDSESVPTSLPFMARNYGGLALARNQDLPGSVKLISISACPLSKTKRIKAEVHFGFILHFAFRICERRHARIHIYLNNYSEGGSGWEGHSPVVLFMMGIQMLCQKDFTYKRASRGKSAEESHCPFCQETSWALLAGCCKQDEGRRATGTKTRATGS